MNERKTLTLSHTPTVQIDRNLLNLYSAELHEAHRLLDTIGIPMSSFEQQLSISQRVAQAVEMVQRLRTPKPVIPWATPE
jgi:hypothetical protein